MSSPRIRLFVAVPLPPAIRNWAGASIDVLRDRTPGARWVDPATMHITCKFIGWMDPSHLDEVIGVVSHVARGHRASELAIGALGAFPRPTRARVLWAGLQDPDSLLSSMAGELDRDLAPLGVVPESRAFTAHLTLARLKVPAPVDLEIGLPSPPPAFRADRLVLYRSRLSPQGARYESIHSEYFGER